MPRNQIISQYWLKIILNFWTIITLIIFVIDFLSSNRFDSSASAIGVIYLAILGIYSGGKEYNRWRTKFKSRFAGEIYVIAWTIVMAVFVIGAPLSKGLFKVPTEFAVVYTTVVGVFAMTRYSRKMRERKYLAKN